MNLPPFFGVRPACSPARGESGWLRGLLAVVAAVVVAAAVFGLGPPRPALAAPPIPPQDLARVLRWEVVAYSEAVPNSPVRRGRAVGLFNATPAQVFEVVADYGSWAQFLRRMRGSRVVRRVGRDQVFAVLETSLPWPVSDAWAHVKCNHYSLGRGKGYRITISMLSGTLRRYSAELRLEAWDGGQRTMVTYDMEAEPATAAPTGVVTKGVRMVAQRIVEGFRARVDGFKRAGKWSTAQPGLTDRRPAAGG